MKLSYTALALLPFSVRITTTDLMAAVRTTCPTLHPVSQANMVTATDMNDGWELILTINNGAHVKQETAQLVNMWGTPEQVSALRKSWERVEISGSDDQGVKHLKDFTDTCEFLGRRFAALLFDTRFGSFV